MNDTVSGRTLTELDRVRLNNLIRPDTVMMYSQVVVSDVHTRQQSTLTPCYPPDAAPGRGWVCALSPVGWGLLGRHVGEVAHWSTPADQEQGAEIAAILYQPEASGNYTV